MKPIDADSLRPIATPVVEGLGYELVELEWKHESAAWVVRVFIDKAGGVSHEDCVRTSRALSAEFDVADPIHVPYTLEVSSPGINRPLRSERDFARFVGKSAKIRTRHPVGPDATATRRNFRGTLVAAAEGKVSIDVEGERFDIPVDDVEKANLEPEL